MFQSLATQKLRLRKIMSYALLGMDDFIQTGTVSLFSLVSEARESMYSDSLSRLPWKYLGPCAQAIFQSWYQDLLRRYDACSSICRNPDEKDFQVEQTKDFLRLGGDIYGYYRWKSLWSPSSPLLRFPLQEIAPWYVSFSSEWPIFGKLNRKMVR